MRITVEQAHHNPTPMLKAMRRGALHGMGKCGLGMCTDAQEAACAGTLDAFCNCVTNPDNPIAAALASEETGQISPSAAQAFIGSTEQTYCELNQQNNAIFGTALDPSCATGEVATGVNNTVANAAGVVSGGVINSAPVPTPVVSTPAITPTVSTPTPASPASSSSAPSSSSSTSTSSAMSDFESWLNGSMIGGIPNWGLLAAGVAALLILPSMLGGHRR